jgi:hypothetical protein
MKKLKKWKNSKGTAIKFFNDEEKVPVGYNFIKCNVKFEVKMDFAREIHFVVGGQITSPPEYLAHSSVLSRDSIRIDLLIALTGVG